MSRNYMRYLHVLPCDHLTSWQEPHMAHGAIMMPDQKSFQTTNCSLQIAAKRGKTTPLRMTDTSRINPRFVYSKLSKVTPPASTRLFGTWHWLPYPVKRTTISTSSTAFTWCYIPKGGAISVPIIVPSAHRLLYAV